MATAVQDLREIELAGDLRTSRVNDALLNIKTDNEKVDGGAENFQELNPAEQERVGMNLRNMVRQAKASIGVNMAKDAAKEEVEAVAKMATKRAGLWISGIIAANLGPLLLIILIAIIVLVVIDNPGLTGNTFQEKLLQQKGLPNLNPNAPSNQG